MKHFWILRETKIDKIPLRCAPHRRIDFRDVENKTTVGRIKVVDDLIINTVDDSADDINYYNDDDA